MEKQFFNITTLATIIIAMFTIVIFYSFPKFAFCQECAVEIEIYETSARCYLVSPIDELLKKRKLNSFEFTGDNKTDKETFNRYREKVHLLVQSNDTTKMIRFKFNKYTNYQNFIDAFDVCLIEGAKYSYVKNDLWVINESRNYPKNSKELPVIIKQTKK